MRKTFNAFLLTLPVFGLWGAHGDRAGAVAGVLLSGMLWALFELVVPTRRRVAPSRSQ